MSIVNVSIVNVQVNYVSYIMFLFMQLYRKHFVQLASHKFPDQYYEALRMAINCEGEYM